MSLAYGRVCVRKCMFILPQEQIDAIVINDPLLDSTIKCECLTGYIIFSIINKINELYNTKQSPTG